MIPAFSMARRFVRLLIFAVLLVSTAAAIPPGFVRDNSTREPSGASSLSVQDIFGADMIDAVGDTVDVFCPLKVFSFSPADGGSDCWGWRAPDGTEYAIMGTSDGVTFVDATNLHLIQTIPGPTQFCGSVRWRDMMTYGQYCYVVSECQGQSEGIMIIDMQYLPDSLKLVNVFTSVTNFTSHNLVVDTSRGFLYAVNRSYNGFRIIDLSDPVNPVEIGNIGEPDIHDMFARNDTVWVAEGSNGTFSVWNLTDKNNPELVNRTTVPVAGYVHNIWPSADGQHVVTTEETAGKTVKYWDVSDYNNVQLVGQYLASSNLAHNAHMLGGDTVVLSHYQSGVVAVDFSNPASPVQLFSYDTYPSGEASGFDGAWGVYPFAPSGRIYASNVDNRLFIIENQTIPTTDTLRGDTSDVTPGGQVRIDVSIEHSFPISGIHVPFEWAGPLNMTLDSISTYGLRTEYFGLQSYTAYDAASSRAAFGIVTSTGQSSLAPGSGPVMSLYLSVPEGATGDSTFNPVSLSGFNSTLPQIQASCVQFEARTASATVVLIDQNCCVDATGNVNGDSNDNVDLSDLTALVNNLFVTFEVLPCPEEANVSGDAGGAIDVSDVTALVNHLFVTFDPLPPCQ